MDEFIIFVGVLVNLYYNNLCYRKELGTGDETNTEQSKDLYQSIQHC